MARRLAAALLTTALLVATAPAHADTRTVKDDYNGSIPALNVKSGTFRYGEHAAVIRVRFEALSRKKTMLVTKYLRRDDVTIQVATKFVNGDNRVLVHRSDSDSHKRIPARNVAVRWNFEDDVIRVEIAEKLLFGRSAAFLAWSQPKNAQHGSPRGDDELFVPRLRRG